MNQVSPELDLEAALQHPRSFFAEPKDVVSEPTLSRDKASDLREWELDVLRYDRPPRARGSAAARQSMLGRVEDAIARVQRQA